MKYRKLGKSSLEVSVISFGGMSMPVDQPIADQLISKAVDGGINLFDTADLYNQGANELMLGKALKSYRKKVFIATKVGNQWRPDNSGWDWNPSKQYIISQVENSLQRLGTDYIDLYQLHGGTIDDPIDETISAFEELIQKGKIRFYGISSIRPNVIREYVQRSSISSVMMQYSLLDRRPEELCLPLLAASDIGVLARGSIAKGLLGGKPADKFLNYDKLEVHKLSTAIRSISSDGRSEMQTSVNYVLQQQAVTSAVIGVRTMAQLDEALAVPETLALTAQELAYLNQILHQNFYEEHR
ncbi:aldo/keto reductase [Flavitalea sp.]|nr:aldo/keto reductase [Flavitalea sp.]